MLEDTPGLLLLVSHLPESYWSHRVTNDCPADDVIRPHTVQSLVFHSGLTSLLPTAL